MNRAKFLKVLGIGAVGAVVAPKAIAKSLVKPPAMPKIDGAKAIPFEFDEIGQFPHIASCDPISPKETLEVYKRTGNVIYKSNPMPKWYRDFEYEMFFGRKP